MNEKDKNAGGLAAARRMRGPAAKREHAAGVAENGIDSIAARAPERLAHEIAASIESMLIPDYASPTFMRRAEVKLVPYLKRLQEAHRSNLAKAQQETSILRLHAKNLYENVPAADAPPLAWQLWQEKLALLAGINKEK